MELFRLDKSKSEVLRISKQGFAQSVNSVVKHDMLTLSGGALHDYKAVLHKAL